MGFLFTGDMKADLKEVNQAFHESLKPWWDELSVYLERVKQDLTFNLLPAVTIVAYRQVGLSRETTIAMANLFKTIYFANWIHGLVKDEEEGQKYHQPLQFTILIGDYISGRILKLLLEAGASHLLEDFSKMMCSINEGLVIEHKLNGENLVVLDKTRGSLYATVFRTAGELAGLNWHVLNIYEELGHNLGMAMELTFCMQGQAKDFIGKTESLFERFSAQQKYVDQPLLGLIHELSKPVSFVNPAAMF
ncbi:MAG: hypothetical protein U9N81_07175 [Bacillota bacterium]|nr:hypothetical protein [Bacillota bacterium]